jgi:hypothetical protein
MPKPSGSDQPAPVRGVSRAAPPSRKIMHQPAPTPGPHHNPPSGGGQTSSNDLAADAVRIARNPGSIDPRQQR